MADGHFINPSILFGPWILNLHFHWGQAGGNWKNKNHPNAQRFKWWSSLGHWAMKCENCGSFQRVLWGLPLPPAVSTLQFNCRSYWQSSFSPSGRINCTRSPQILADFGWLSCSWNWVFHKNGIEACGWLYVTLKHSVQPCWGHIRNIHDFGIWQGGRVRSRAHFLNTRTQLSISHCY